MDVDNQNILLEYILPIAGIIGFFYCLFFLYSRRNEIKELKHKIDENKIEEINIQQLGTLKISTLPLILMIISVVFILPPLFYSYNHYKTLASDLEKARLAIENNRILINEIQNCRVPICFTLEGTDSSSSPSLDDMDCKIVFNSKEVTTAYPSYAGFDGYLMHGANINCNSKLKAIIVELKDGTRKWSGNDVEPCMYVNNPVQLKLMR